MTPGEPLPAGASTSMASLAASATTVLVMAVPTSDSSPSATAGSGKGGEVNKASNTSALSTGAIVGIVIGVIALLVFAGGLFR